MKLSVVIPALNAADTIGAQLRALAHQTSGSEAFEVIIADNGSVDGTVDVALSFAASLDLRVIDASRLRGASTARNIGIEAAHGDVILLCDADDEVDVRWLDALRSRFDSGAQLVGVSVDVTRLNSERSIRQRGIPAGIWLHRGFMPAAIGAGMGFTRALFDEIGGFDESVSGGADDVGFCWRAQLAGYTLESEPAAVVHYRLRKDGRAFWSQMVGYGAGDAHLYQRYRAHGMHRRGPAAIARSLAWFAWKAPRTLVDPLTRAVWIRQLGLQVGRIKGSIRYRTLYL